MFCAVRGTCRHTAKNICAVCFFSAHGIAFPANLFIAREIYLDISREILGRAANLRILVNYFAVIIHKGSRQRYLCRDACICRVFWFRFAVSYSLPCARGLLCRASFICRDLPVSCTAKFSLPCSGNLRHTAETRPHGKFKFSGSEKTLHLTKNMAY